MLLARWDAASGLRSRRCGNTRHSCRAQASEVPPNDAEPRSHCIVFVIVVLIGHCSAVASQPRRDLVPVPVPEPSGLEPSVRNALARARGNSNASPPTSPQDDAGWPTRMASLAMTYHAQNFVPAAEAAYANARACAGATSAGPTSWGISITTRAGVRDAIPASSRRWR